MSKRNIANYRDFFSPNAIIKGITLGERKWLSRGITLIESLKPEHIPLKSEVISALIQHSGKSLRLGITGSPGVGKSTLISKIGAIALKDFKKIAVLTIDPSSSISGGSILGDKTRMAELSRNPRIYIRPSPTKTYLGGVAANTRDAIILCEAAGFDLVIIETVGTGQSEIEVSSMVDLFALVILPGAGDDLQGIKRGVMELADICIINKSEDSRRQLVQNTKRSYENAIHLFQPKESSIEVSIICTSGLQNRGIDLLWEHIKRLNEIVTNNNYKVKNRKQQESIWYEKYVKLLIHKIILNKPNGKETFIRYRQKVERGELSAYTAAEMLILELFENHA